MMWLNYPENKPKSGSGYYYTYYFNHEQGRHFYKAFVWSNDRRQLWIFRFDPQVIAFIEQSRNDYYIPCMQWSNDHDVPSFPG